ncbi:choice-of-anchor Q domain-containing protein [Elongatibacter sediminis]|uniref:Ig-like domain-containing protein n=1 Tax=Elongatibacter sediminis TaxID=3119006 RepID=A0AAW9RG55_9GAMM
MTIRHSTITDNHADSNDNGSADSGGGVYVLNGGSVTLANNLIAANRTGSGSIDSHDLRGVFTTTGYNLVGDNRGAAASFPAGTPNASNDTVGAGPLNSIDPELNVLGMDGGPTPTHSLGFSSPAIDQGRCTSQTADQHGYGNEVTGLRAVDQPVVTNLDDGCDIGAFERGATTTNDPPVANDDSYTVLEDVLFEATDLDGQTTSGDSADDGVLANDTDSDSSLFVSNGGSFTADGLGGSVELAADGGFTYQSPADQSGLATFEYTASDGSDSDSATVSLTVLPVNDAPGFTAASALVEVDESAGPQTVSG